jgi:hypothetical protein
VQHLSAAGREAGTEEQGGAGVDARIRRKSAMAWRKCPSDAVERIRCAHDGGNGAAAPAAAAARGRGCMLVRGAWEAAKCWLRLGCGGDADAGVMVQSDVRVHRIGTGVMVSWQKVNVDGSLDAGTGTRQCWRAAALGDEAGTAPRSRALEDETRAAEMISGCRSSNRLLNLTGSSGRWTWTFYFT